MTEAAARGLCEPCKGRRSKGNAYRLSRFSKGKHPKRDEAVDGPRPWPMICDLLRKWVPDEADNDPDAVPDEWRMKDGTSDAGEKGPPPPVACQAAARVQHVDVLMGLDDPDAIPDSPGEQGEWGHLGPAFEEPPVLDVTTGPEVEPGDA